MVQFFDVVWVCGLFVVGAFVCFPSGFFAFIAALALCQGHEGFFEVMLKGIGYSPAKCCIHIL